MVDCGGWGCFCGCGGVALRGLFGVVGVELGAVVLEVRHWNFGSRAVVVRIVPVVFRCWLLVLVLVLLCLGSFRGRFVVVVLW